MLALVVDRQKSMRILIRSMLRDMEIFEEVHETTDGDAGWKMVIMQANYDIVICDVGTPELDGIRLLRLCRQNEDSKFLPFLMVSGSSDEALIAVAVGEWGASDYLIKPFSFEAFQKRVLRVLKEGEEPQSTLFRHVEEMRKSGYTRAALELLDAAELDGKLSAAKLLNSRGECLMDLGETEKAAEEFKKAIEVSKIFVTAYKNYYSANMLLGDEEKALETLEQLEGIAPSDNERSLLLSEFFIRKGDAEKAWQHIDRALKHCSSEECLEVLKKTAALMTEHKLFDEAEKACERVIDIDDTIDNYNRLGVLYRRQGKYAEAEKCYYRALKSQNLSHVVYYNMAVLYLVQKDYAKAIKYFNKTLQQDPDFTAAREMLEEVQLKLAKGAKRSPHPLPVS
jgi:tetratricopeptide (TPR) repeat protein